MNRFSYARSSLKKLFVYIKNFKDPVKDNFNLIQEFQEFSAQFFQYSSEFHFSTIKLNLFYLNMCSYHSTLRP